MDWMEFLGCLNVLKNSYPSLDKIKSDLDEMYELIASVNLAAENSEYKIGKISGNAEVKLVISNL